MSETDIRSLIEAANHKALETLLSAEPVWIGVKQAIDVLSGISERTILHAGPPIAWQEMADLQKKGIVSGILFENLARSEKEALDLIEGGEISIGAASDYGVVGAGSGIVTPSMMLNVCEDKKSKMLGCCPIWEGREGLTAWGIYNDEVRARLTNIKNILGPSLDHILTDCGGLPLKSIIAKGMQMGDEMHTRHVAQGMILSNEMVLRLIKSRLPIDHIIHCTETLINTERWFHSLGMASSMASLNAIKGIKYCTLLTMMAGNGVNFGIKVSCLGEEWFQAPAPAITGRYLAAMWGPDDAIPWLGESCIVETAGLGGLSAAAAPTVILLRGGSVRDAIAQTEEMGSICFGTNHNYPIPLLEFNGPPVGLDIRKILYNWIAPCIHGGILSKTGGQIGAGFARVPMECVKKAFYAFADRYNITED